ncbi:nucleotidyltransferase [Candidatus Cryosericum odellii]|uniref:Nucleotidyltransferase n=2 Tax=Candidatus Cryosericum odellii TaxID=2290917 RepID=A0A398D3L6_9BACT|nr:nucleotidyltransferase [Candidatus Cryosericum odellii]RIE10116.1 nucleotidyltransferase [Candidatus Cryosericum odellii]
MATTVSASFQKLKEDIEITGLQTSDVSTRQNNVRDVVAGDMDVLGSFLTGSYSRSTLIAPLPEADIDVFVVLDPKYFERNGQASLLDKTRRALLKTYTRTPKVSRNGQAVTITFTDFAVDVVPAFNRSGGGYLIPDSIHNVWIETDPRVHVKAMIDANAIHNGDLVPVVKMIKCWNRNIGYDFVSFYLELLAIKVFANVTISNYSSGMRFFFDKGREAIRYSVKDPAGYGKPVQGFRNCQTAEDAVRRFETAHTDAIVAEQYAKDGYSEKAIDEWRNVFGDYFPAYG